MKSDVECPYCGEEQEINHDDGYGYGESDLYQQECSRCDKVFVFTTAIHFAYNTYQADCLNGGKHKYEKTNTYPPQYARLRCKDCGDEKPLPQEGI